MDFTDRQYFLVAVVFYGLGLLYSVFLWRRGFRRDHWINHGLLVLAFVLHTTAMVKRGFTLEHCPVNNLYEATIFILWTITATCLVAGLWIRLRFLGAFTAPLLFAVGVFAMMPGLDPPYADEPNFINGWSSLHAALVMLSYGAFGLSGAAGAMFLTQERDLKMHRARALLPRFPSLERLEKLITAALAGGFVLLTAGLGVGSVWLKMPAGASFWGDSKVLWSILVWAIYLLLLVLRGWFDQRGRRFAWSAIISFGFVILTFWGTNLLSLIHNPVS